MLEVGDYTMYGSNGVCKVMEIGHLDISCIDKSKIFYTMQPVYAKRSTVYTPVDNAKGVMRNILSKAEAWELIDDIPSIPIFCEETDKRLELKLKEAMKKYDCWEWIKVIKTLYSRKEERSLQGKKITGTDEKYLQTAEDFLFGELSISLNISKDKIEDLISERLKVIELSKN